MIVKKYRESLINRSILADIKKEFKTVEKLFIFLKKRNNFLVDAAKGQIIVLPRKVEGKKLLEKELDIKLKLVKEMERKEELSHIEKQFVEFEEL